MCLCGRVYVHMVVLVFCFVLCVRACVRACVSVCVSFGFRFVECDSCLDFFRCKYLMRRICFCCSHLFRIEVCCCMVGEMVCLNHDE